MPGYENLRTSSELPLCHPRCTLFVPSVGFMKVVDAELHFLIRVKRPTLTYLLLDLCTTK